MTIRLTLALLALPLIPFQEPNPLVCKHVNPANISTNNPAACKNNDGEVTTFCNVDFLFIQDQDGNCLAPGDCNWLFNVKITNCTGVSTVVITYLDSNGDPQTCSGPVDPGTKNVGTLGPASVILDCGTQSTSQFFITFKDANGKKVGRCKPLFQCLQCTAIEPQ